MPLNRPVLLTGGDPAGISPEIIEDTISDLGSSKRSVIYLATGGKDHLHRIRKILQRSGYQHNNATVEKLLSGQGAEPGIFNLVDLTDKADEKTLHSGKPTRRSGELSFMALRTAVDIIETSGCYGLITAPLSKGWVMESGESDFSGHTGYLAARAERTVVMLMHGVKFSVLPVTEHLPLMQVSRVLKEKIENPEFENRLHDIASFESYKQRPWALCALNPHGGEEGKLGTEEIDFLEPIARKWRSHNLPVEGPLPADGIFQSEPLSRYRLILSSYHDQGLIPFKALEGENGINVTIGLPYVRVSPDHGTAYAIAGRGIASSVSMRRAIAGLISGEFETGHRCA